MARYCFYCNRELASGESCHCRANARETLRRQKEAANQAPPEPAPGATVHEARSERVRQTPPRPAERVSRIDWSAFKPSILDITRPLDRLAHEPHALLAALFWLGINALLSGAFFFTATGQAIFFALGVTIHLISALIFYLLIVVHYRFRLRQPIHVKKLFGQSRPAFLHGSLFSLLATFAVIGNPIFGFFLYLASLLTYKSGLLWQLHQNSPLERNQYLLSAVLTLFLDGLFLSVFFQWALPIGIGAMVGL